MLYAYQKRKIIIKLDMSESVISERLTLETLLLNLEREAEKIKIYNFQWPLDDYIFKYCTVGQFKQACENTLKKVTISLIHPTTEISDESKRLELMTQFHDDPVFGGHCGQKKLYSKLRSHYYWRNMSNDIKLFVKNCPKCKVNKVLPSHREPMHITKTPQKPFEIIIIDTVGPLPVSLNGNLYVLTIICDLTKYLVAIPMTDKSAKSVAKALFENFILTYSVMKSIRTDRGTEFLNELINELCAWMKIENNSSTAHRHQTVGTVERNHRVLNEYIRSYISENLQCWEEYLRYFAFCYNIQSNSALGEKFTPFELVFSRKANLPTDLFSNGVEPVYNVDNYIKEAKYRLQKAHEQAAQLLEKSKIRNKILYDKNTDPIKISIGDRVYVNQMPYNKHKPIRTGVYDVIAVKHPNVEIRNPKTGKNQLVHKDRITKA